MVTSHRKVNQIRSKLLPVSYVCNHISCHMTAASKTMRAKDNKKINHNSRTNISGGGTIVETASTAATIKAGWAVSSCHGPRELHTPFHSVISNGNVRLAPPAPAFALEICFINPETSLSRDPPVVG